MIKIFGLAALIALSACQSSGEFSPDGLPGRASSAAEDVDGLIVGHRLMEGGEYELALRAYYRSMAEQGPTVDALSAIGSANLHLGRLGQADQMFRRAIEFDPEFVPAINNLGVVMVERADWGQAAHLFRTAFALDSGRSEEIRQNLRLALANLENSSYTDENNNNNFALVRRGNGRFLLLATP
ncbi:tetratricopeptide repeat protein [Pararhodobacter zhoushanensis]|uniref:tetratricopeptide repeat protein n=1 Tax=Pararhodobacter zhoushanensis TaxID=2479545 RepID=UPI000F8F033D|nr:tetratricopeptide repeat protein [Pararhodobacter zhoushanensis]